MTVKNRPWVEDSRSFPRCSRAAAHPRKLPRPPAQRARPRRPHREPAARLLQRGKYQPRTDMRPNRCRNSPIPSKHRGWCSPFWCGRFRGVMRANLSATRSSRVNAAGARPDGGTRRDLGGHSGCAGRGHFAMALIENIQREDLNPLEEARALSRLIEEFGLTHQAAAEAVGRSGRGEQFTAAHGARGRGQGTPGAAANRDGTLPAHSCP